MGRDPTRRQFLHQTAVLGTAVAAMRMVDGVDAAEPSPGRLPQIKLGTLQVSRLILGSNPFFGFAHKPGDAEQRMKAYYTPRRIMAVMDEAAEHGITAVWTPPYPHWIRLWNEYRDRGGKLRIWIGQPDPEPSLMKQHITAAAENGARAICIQGERIDAEFRAGRWDVLRQWLDHAHSYGLPAGMASHRPDVHLAAEAKGLPTDFYHQCFFRPETYTDEVRAKAIAAIKRIDKPVVGYKVLAAGRRQPQEAFSYAFRHLARKDGICVGVFPKDQPGQISENATLTRELSRANS